jgi:adiponectin receptor
VYTHAIGVLGCLFFALLDEVSVFESSSNGDRLALLCLLAGAGVCMACSTVFHLFCCHSKESCLKYQKLDYLGICGIIMGSFVPIAYFGFYCDPTIQIFYMFASFF